jgi:hypothetical protein
MTPKGFAKGLFIVITVGVVTSVPRAAEAALITFEGSFNTIYAAPITRLGFDIGNPAGQEQHFHEITSTQFGLPNNGTGVLLNDRNTQIFVVATGGPTPFNLSSVDVASALNNNPAVGLTIMGFLNNILVGVITVPVLGQGYTTVSGATLGVVDRLLFDGIGGQGGFVLDNLAINETPTVVPEPTSLMLFGSGAAMVALARRRRKSIKN